MYRCNQCMLVKRTLRVIREHCIDAHGADPKRLDDGGFYTEIEKEG